LSFVRVFPRNKFFLKSWTILSDDVSGSLYISYIFLNSVTTIGQSIASHFYKYILHRMIQLVKYACGNELKLPIAHVKYNMVKR